MKIEKRIHLFTRFVVNLILLGFVWGQVQNITSEDLVLRVGPSLQIDGQLEEPIWRRALSRENILVPHPDRDKAEQVETKVFLHQDGDFLYVGFICNDPSPQQITATVKQHDGELRNDDSVYVLLLAGKNQEYIYFFGLNPLNTQLESSGWRYRCCLGNKVVVRSPEVGQRMVS